MARTVVDSPRVLAEIQRTHPNRVLKTVLHRGNYPNNTFLAVFEDDPRGERVTIPPVSKKREHGEPHAAAHS